MRKPYNGWGANSIRTPEEMMESSNEQNEMFELVEIGGAMARPCPSQVTRMQRIALSSMVFLIGSATWVTNTLVQSKADFTGSSNSCAAMSSANPSSAE